MAWFGIIVLRKNFENDCMLLVNFVDGFLSVLFDCPAVEDMIKAATTAVTAMRR